VRSIMEEMEGGVTVLEVTPIVDVGNAEIKVVN
jgi:hypothetical protein